MADIRIKDLPTTATQTASDDFIALDGTVNGTRKIDASAPSFKTSVTSPSVVAPAATNLTLAGGSTGASLVLGQGANASTVFTGTGTGLLSFTKATGNPEIRAIATPGGAGVFRAYTPSTSVLSVYGLYSVLEGNGNKWENGFYGTLDYVHRYNDSEKLRFTTTGNLLIGTTTDSGNGKLQLATHTTSAGGIGFGTDVSLFRSATGVLRLASTSNYLHEIVNTAGTSAATTVYSNTGGSLFVGIDSASGGAIGGGAYAGVISRDGAYPLILRTNGTTALTLASNQAATFAGAVTVTGSGSSSDSFKITGDTAGIGLQVGTTGTVNLYRAAADKWATDDAFSVGGAFTPLGNIYFPTNSNLTSSGSIGTQASAGLSLWSKTGSIYDFTIYDAAGNLAITMPTGTRNLSIASTTPSGGAGSGALQVAGGIYAGAASVFGGAITTQSSGGDSGLIIKRNSSPYVDFYDGGTSGTIRAEILADNDGVSGGNFKIQTRNNAGTITLAATFDKAQAATFAGAVTVNSSITAGTGSLSLNGSSGNGVNIHNTLTSGVSIGAVPTVVGILSVRPVADGIFNFRNAAGLGSYTGGAIDMLNDASNTVTNLTIRAAETNFIGVGATKIASTTPSTGAGSGALQVAGGIYSGAASVFGGAVTAPSATIKRASTSEDAFTNFYTGGSPYWTVGLQAVGTSNDFRIVNAQSGNRSLSISTTTEAATFAGTVIAPAATTAISSVRLPHGTAPTSPVNGDMWTTTAGLYVRINGVTVGPLS